MPRLRPVRPGPDYPALDWTEPSSSLSLRPSSYPPAKTGGFKIGVPQRGRKNCIIGNNILGLLKPQDHRISKDECRRDLLTSTVRNSLFDLRHFVSLFTIAYQSSRKSKLQYLSNLYCHPGRAVGSPNGLGLMPGAISGLIVDIGVLYWRPYR
jgi:hypothetical protein